MRDDWSCGTGVFATVGSVLVALKLANSLDWPWWWVVAPLWLPMALFVALAIIVGFLQVIDGCFTFMNGLVSETDSRKK